MAAVDDKVWADLERAGKTDVFCHVAGALDVDMSAFEGTRKERAQVLHDKKEALCKKHQSALIARVEEKGLKYKPFWIVNKVFVEDADRAFVDELAQRADVVRIEGNRQMAV